MDRLLRQHLEKIELNIKEKVRKTSKIKLSLILFIILVVAFFGSALIFADKNEGQSNQKKNNAVAQKNPNTNSEQKLPEVPIKRIEAIAKKRYSKFDVESFSKNGDLGNESNGPYDVIINTTSMLNECYGAKNVSFDVIRDLYTDSITKNNILRVKVNALPFASASLGNKDAKTLTNDMWKDNGPTNFTKSLQSSGSSENPELPLENQTYWQNTFNCPT